MTTDEINRIKRRATYFIRAYGLHKYTEDLVQDVLLQYCKKKAPADVKYAVVDAIRIRFGRQDKQNQAGKLKKNLTLFYTDLEEFKTKEAPEQFKLFEFNSIVRHAEGKFRSALVLFYLYDFRQIEIAYILGCTESRVAQMLKEGLKQIREKAGELR